MKFWQVFCIHLRNYLSKVAWKPTSAKRFVSRALAATKLDCRFRTGLRKPIFVSTLLHLTGLWERIDFIGERSEKYSFPGLSYIRKIFRYTTKSVSYVWTICKINKVKVQGEIVAFGFLCGRDYETKHYVGGRQKSIWLIQERNKVLLQKKTASFTKR